MDNPITNPSDTGIAIQWIPRSDVAIFIRALHLLDLDLLPDFPGISEWTFTSNASVSQSHISTTAGNATGTASKLPSSRSTNINPKPTSTSTSTAKVTTQNAPPSTSRVKAIEWCLYRLFEILNPEETRAKLAAYFPPTTPSHSLNLRAALYKWLTELKKDGSLPREMVLRKTMLDEGKGEKFDELMARFAMFVVRRSLTNGPSGKAASGKDGVVSIVKGKQPPAQITAPVATEAQSNPKSRARSITVVSRNLNNDQTQNQDQIPHLNLAYRVSLHQSLLKRQALRQKATTAVTELDRLQHDINRRLQAVSEPEPKDDSEEFELSEQEYDALKDQIYHAFAAERQWGDYILHGNPAGFPSSSAVTAAGASVIDFISSWDNTGKSQFQIPAKSESEPEAETFINQPVTSFTQSESRVSPGQEAMTHLHQSILEHQARTQRLSRLRESILAARRCLVDESQLAPLVAETESDGHKPCGADTERKGDHTFTTTTTPATATVGAGPRFNRHQALTMASIS
ncbi:hypothetical protein KCU88_g3567, partial [Aureobasidium melanogenum]